jgi:hypothetical protein
MFWRKIQIAEERQKISTDGSGFDGFAGAAIAL